MKKRDHTIDVLRGLAIFAMIAANMAAHNFKEPHPFIFRLFGSFAAPTFVFLAGLMVPYNSQKKEYHFLYFALRGLATIVVASLLDIFCWKLMPFTTFDVLYIIGISLPVVFLVQKINKWLHLLIALLFFAATPFVQLAIGYAPVPTEIDLLSENILEQLKVYPQLNHFIADGWFPVFPWVGVSLFGCFIGRLRLENTPEKGNKIFLVAGMIMMIAGIISWKIQNPNLLIRDGYSELFYPPTIGYFLTFLGLILILLSQLYQLKYFSFLYFFAIFGRSSLLMYVLHTILIVSFFNVSFGAKGFLIFVQLYLMHAFLLWWTALFVQEMKEHVKKLPFVLRFVIGG